MGSLKDSTINGDLTVSGNLVCNSLNESLQNIDIKKQNSFLNETPIEVTNCASLNEILEPGWYWCRLQGVNDIPSTSNIYGVLEIIKVNSNCYLQRYTVYNTGATYVRVYTNGQWYSWNQI